MDDDADLHVTPCIDNGVTDLWKWTATPVFPLLRRDQDLMMRGKHLYYGEVSWGTFLFKLGDGVHLRSTEDGSGVPYVARIKALYEQTETKAKLVTVEWLFRPEETKQGRKHFHGFVS